MTLALLHSTEKFRLFIALSIPDAVKNRIEKVQTNLRGCLGEKTARWTRREQFHLTLRFLGNVGVDRVDQLSEAARIACRSCGALHLTAARLGFFPEPCFPRVLWVGVKDAQDQLVSLWTAIESAVRPFTQEPAEKSFTGHVTLARFKRLGRSQADELVRATAEYSDVVFGHWTRDKLELMRSELHPQGSRHTVVAEFQLAGEANDEGGPQLHGNRR